MELSVKFAGPLLALAFSADTEGANLLIASWSPDEMRAALLEIAAMFSNPMFLAGGAVGAAATGSSVEEVTKMLQKRALDE